MNTDKNIITHSLLITILLIISAYSQIKHGNQDDSIFNNVINKIVLTDTELSNKSSSNIKAPKMDRVADKIIIDTTVRDTIARDTTAFRDTMLEKRYYYEYYTTGEPDTIDSTLCILPDTNATCNIESGKTVYGFVNIHMKHGPIKIDFKLFDRIGIYSIFPEKYGSIEMIFKGNNTVKNPEKCFVKYAHRYNTKVDLVVSKYIWPKDTTKKTSKKTHKDTISISKLRIDQDVVILSMVDSLVSVLKTHKFDGITFDFDISKMDTSDIANYKELLYFVHKEVKKYNKFLNVIVNRQDIYDLLNTNGTTKDDTSKNRSYSKVEFLLKPYLINQINHLIVKDTSINADSLHSIKKVFSDYYLMKNVSNIIGLLPPYNNRSDNVKLMLDILSIEHGLALWNIDTISKKFSDKINKNKYSNSNIINFPRKYIITNIKLVPIRSFVDSNSTTILILLSLLIVSFIICIVYMYKTGGEKYLKKGKIIFIVTGIVLSLLSCFYILLYPFNMNYPVFWILVGIILLVSLIVVAHNNYKSIKREDLP
jgi:hypothetical protein